jgi:hypothetical protein
MNWSFTTEELLNRLEGRSVEELIDALFADIKDNPLKTLLFY